MTKLIKLCMAMLLATSFLSASNEAKEVAMREYQAKLERKITNIAYNPINETITILLNDGTQWGCYYRFISDRQRVLERWQVGQMTWILPARSNNVTFHLWSYSNAASSGVELLAFLDPNTSQLLPIIVEKTAEGHLLLSDGSEWRDNSWIVPVASYWNVGERIVISKMGETFRLMNIDQGEGLFLNTGYMFAILVDVHR